MFILGNIILLQVAGVASYAQVRSEDKEISHLDTGFGLLESGQFNEAFEFFTRAIEIAPANKTVRICYGRSMGLSGQPSDALDLFIDMSLQEPGDLEISLNLAEAYLWNDMHKHALDIYDSLLLQYPDNFTVKLGLGNSLAGLKRNQEAFRTIQEALIIKPGDPGARISEKYIGLAYTSDLSNKEKDPEAALKIINELLNDRVDDFELNQAKAIILTRLERYDDAEKVYLQMDGENVLTILGRSRVLVLNGDLEGALLLAKKAVDVAMKAPERLNLSEAIAHLHSMQLRNRNYREAEAMLHLADSIFPLTSQTILSKAEFNMHTAQYSRGLQTYEQILDSDPESFGANLGSANALHALGLDKAAYRKSFQTLSLYPGQQDTHSFINKLHSIHSPYVNATAQVFKDSDNSITRNHKVSLEGSIDPQLKFNASLQKRTSGSLNFDETVVTDYLNVGVSMTLSKVAKINTRSGILFVNDDTGSYSRWLGELAADLRLNANHSISIGLRREQQDFNRNLILQDLTMDHLFLRSNMYWVKRAWGWYSEYFHTLQSDGNRRRLLFTSFYKNVTPGFKGGFNLQYIGFDKQFPERYFSPANLSSAEIFAQINKPIFKARGEMNALMATGYIMNGIETQPSLRLDFSLNRKFGGKWVIGIYGLYNSSAERISNGFTYYGGGVNVKYRLMNQPLFNTSDKID